MVTGEASSADFDLTLMIILLNNLADIPIGDKLPAHGDTSEAADLTRIKLYRNFIAHNTDAAICVVDFKSYWADIEQVNVYNTYSNISFCNIDITRSSPNIEKSLMLNL